MKTYKNILILVFLLGSCFHSEIRAFNFVQTGNHSYFFTPQNLGTSTPQVTDMIRYGNISTNKYHGLLDFSIALGGYKDKDFDIPISLKYFSGGFMPSKRPSFVGYNWTLHCGGVITRKLNGSPDDVRGNPVKTSEEYLLDGLLVAIKDGKYSHMYAESQLMNFDVELNKDYLNGHFKHEFESDVYTFAFGNYYGSFIIGHNGMPVLLGDNGLKINISGMTTQSYSTTETPVSSSIEITTPDGTIYTFGGTSNYLEYFIPDNPEGCKIMPRYITSWFLKSIKAPNNRTVNFNYRSKMQMNKYRYLAYAAIFVAFNGTYGTAVPEKENIEVKDKVYTPILDNISVDNVNIVFTYNENAAAFYSGEPEDKSIQLQKISRKVNNTLLDEAEFSYQTKDRYFFLKSVSQKGLKHEFKYNLSQTLPDPMTVSIDHWGFWAGGYASTISNVGNYCIDMYNQRATNPDVCDVGLLNEIIYPTGGKTVITYEPNKYTTYFRRIIESDLVTLPYVTHYVAYKEPLKTNVSSPLSCGGARVQSIKDYSAQNGTPINVRTFLYQDSSNKECGVIGIEPRYQMTEAMYSNFPVMYDVVINISGNNFGSNNLFSEYHIAYPYVTEVFENNGYTKYKFTSRLDVPDSHDIGIKIKLKLTTNLDDITIAEKYGTLFMNDKSSFRGKLVEKTIYDVSGNKILQTVNKYNITDAENKYNISLRSSHRSFGYYKIYLTPCLLMRQETIDENNVSQIVDYKYNKHNFVSEISFVRNDGKKQISQFTYPFELSNSLMTTMTSKNVIADYVERVTYLEEGNTKRVIDGEHRVYSTIGAIGSNLYRPVEIWSLEKNSAITLDALFNPTVLSATAAFNSPNSITTGSFTIPEHSNANVNIKFEYNDNNLPGLETLTLIIDSLATGKIIHQVSTYNLLNPTYDGYSCIGNNANNECRIFTKTIGLYPGIYRIRVTSANYERGDYNHCLWSGTATITTTVKNQTIAASNFLKREVLYGYDEKGNIRTAVSANNPTVPTTYLWGYNSQYPIAKIENANFLEVTGKIAGSTLTNIANKAVPETADWTIINNLRTQLPHAMLTTYTYKPLVGIETITNPRGIKTTYIYDSFNRLKEIRDHNGKTLETYEYNYKQ